MKTTLWLDKCRITGLGESDYFAVRFANYSIDGGKIIPVAGLDEYELPTGIKNCKISGHRLLIELYNLCDQIEFGKKPIHTASVIANWCMKNIHPYEMRELYNEVPNMAEFWKTIKDDERNAKEKLPTTTDPMEMLLRQQEENLSRELSPRERFNVYADRLTGIGEFTTKRFMSDLRELYFAVKVYHAIMAMKDDDRQPAADLAKDGKYSEGMESLSKSILSGSISFAESINEFCYLCRPLKMELGFNARWNEFNYSPVLNTVFDLAWFALFRIAISGTRSAVDDKQTFRTIQCRSCGRTVVATGNNQIFCDDPECQAFKKAKNKREERDRKKKKSKEA